MTILSKTTQNRIVYQRVKNFSLLVLLGFFVASAFHFLAEKWYDLGHPWNTFLYGPSARFSDWFDTLRATGRTAPYHDHSDPSKIPSYFPFTFILLSPLVKFSIRDNIAIFLSVGAGLLISATCIYWHTKIRPVFDKNRNSKDSFYLLAYLLIIPLVSYPTLFAADRGNLDLWIHGLILLSISLYRTQLSLIGAILLGIAASTKGYPIAFSLLFLADRRVTELLTSITVFMLLTLYSFYTLPPGLSSNISDFASGMEAFKQRYIIGTLGMRYFTDPYNMIRLYFYRINGWSGSLTPHLFLDIYSKTIQIVAGILSLYTIFVTKTTWRKLTAIGCLILLYPNISNDYKLMVLYPAIFEFISCKTRESKFQSQVVTCCFILLIIPKHYYFFSNSPLLRNISISYYIAPIALMILTLTACLDIAAWQKTSSKLTHIAVSFLQRKPR